MAIPGVASFCGFLVSSIILIYSPDCTNVDSSRGEEFKGLKVGVPRRNFLFTFAVGCIV